MKRGPVTKLYKRNMVTSNKFNEDVMLANCGIIVIFSIYGHFGTIGNPDSGCMVCET